MTDLGNQVARKCFEKNHKDDKDEEEAMVYPTHLEKLYTIGVLQKASSSPKDWSRNKLVEDEEDITFIHEMNLTITHSNKTMHDELQTILGLLGMYSGMAILKKRIALNGNEFSRTTIAHFVKELFSAELKRRTNTFYTIWKK